MAKLHISCFSTDFLWISKLVPGYSCFFSFEKKNHNVYGVKHRKDICIVPVRILCYMCICNMCVSLNHIYIGTDIIFLFTSSLLFEVQLNL